VSQSLSRWQAVVLGLVVVAALTVGGFGIARIADKQGLWADTFELTAGFPEAHDIAPGTPVRIRGVDAGQVVAVEYPDHDGPGAEVTVRMRLNGRFANRVYADATAQIHGSGLLGSKVIAVNPGTPERGPLADARLRGLKPLNMDEAVADARKTAEEVRALAAETKGLVKDVRESNGTFMKLIKDDDLHKDTKALIARADKAIGGLETTVGGLEKEITGLHGFIQDGRETMRSVKQGTDALGKMPIVRGYVENSTEMLVRPNHKREAWAFQPSDLFQSGKPAELSENGRISLNNIASEIKANKNKNSDIVVVVFCDPADKTQTAASASELTKKQAEAVVAHLKACDVHKLGTFTRRKITPLGMGMNPSPVVEKVTLPPAVVQIDLFTPQ
jgi:phospholipid/cholesterol/gamma-HCH transport system substrate-binding protein